MTVCAVCGLPIWRRPVHGRLKWRHKRPGPNGPHDHPATKKETK